MMRGFLSGATLLVAATGLANHCERNPHNIAILKSQQIPSYSTKEPASSQSSQGTNSTADPEFNYYTYLNGTKSQLFLGSEDPRHGFGLSFGVGRNDPKLKWGNKQGELVWEGYYLETSSTAIDNFPAETTLSWGILATARYRWQIAPGTNFFSDAGFGFQWVNHISEDLRLANNTTPTLGIGMEFNSKNNKAWLFELRLLHVSNGGRTNPNPGQNMLQFIVGLKY